MNTFEKINYWWDRKFPEIMLGIVLFLFLFLIVFGISVSTFNHIEKTSHDYEVYFYTGDGSRTIYLNKDEFKLENGHISFKDGDGIFYLSNFKLTKLK